MSDRYKYAVNGIYKGENFAQQVEQNRFPAINLGSIGGIPRWYLKCTLITEDGEENQMVRCTHKIALFYRLKFYCSPEILNFHCPQFVEQSEKIASNGFYPVDFFRCLQILHGVQLQIDHLDYFDILKVAHFFNLSNVIHYCDRPYNGRYGVRFKSISFCTVVKSNLRHILAEKLRCRKQKEVVKIAKELDFKEATGEAMKALVAKILYN
ncbi:unnamed protein product [Caenorhabditis brenneri]